VVTAFDAEQAVNEAKQSFQWQYGYYPRDLILVTVAEAQHTDNIIHVQAVSKRGKQLIKEHGNLWSHIEGPHPMQCFDGAQGIRIGTTDGCDYTRNVRTTNDKVFFWYYMNGEENAL